MVYLGIQHRYIHVRCFRYLIFLVMRICCIIIIPINSRAPVAIAAMEIVEVGGEFSSSSSAGSSVTTCTLETVVTSTVQSSERKY